MRPRTPRALRGGVGADRAAVRGRCFTGRVIDAYGDNKHARTAEWAARHGVDLAQCVFYTDSFSDRKLMEHVGRPVAVCPDARLAEHARAKGWEIADWGLSAPPQPGSPGGEQYTCSVFGMRLNC